MVFQDWLEESKKKTLKMDCASMTLTQCATDDPIRISGMGSVFQDEDGKLKFKMFVGKFPDIRAIDPFLRYSTSKPGKILGESHYYDFEGVSFRNDRWKATRIDIDVSIIDSDVMVEGEIHSLAFEHNIPTESYYVELHYFENLGVPTTKMSRYETPSGVNRVRDTHEFKAQGWKWTAVQHEDELIISAESETPFPPKFAQRVQEALCYVSGKRVTWDARTEVRGNLVRNELSWDQIELPGRSARPPVPGLHPLHADFYWDLFGKYLSYVISTNSNFDWNYSTYYIQQMYEASAGSIDTWAIGLGVAIEGLCNLIEFETSSQNQDLARLHDKIFELIDGDGSFKPFRQRFENMLPGMFNVSSADRLHRLADKGQVTKKYIKAWKRMRNKSVHPKADLMKVDVRLDYQALLDAINCSTALMWQVTFVLIGYRGKYTDYGEVSMPLRNYPEGI